MVLAHPGTRWAVVAATFGDARDTCVEGESGLLAVFARYGLVEDIHFTWNRSIGEIRLWNKSLIKCYSAEQPKRLRGPGFYGAWCDELAAWTRPETFDMLMFTLSQGTVPQVIISTTPTPTKLIRDLANRDDGTVILVSGSTYDNAENLPEAVLTDLRNRYEGTRLGRQELHAEILLDTPGALWTYDMVIQSRVDKAPDLARVVVAIDPAGGGSEDDGADETGIAVCGRGVDGRGYLLADYSGYYSSADYARRALHAYDVHQGDEIVYEDNGKDDTVKTIIHQLRPGTPVRGIHAVRGKVLRASPIAALFEQGRFSMVGDFTGGTPYEKLEEQMTTFVEGDPSPDHLDAFVHAATALNVGAQRGLDDFLDKIARDCPKCEMPNAPTAKNCYACGEPLQSDETEEREPADVSNARVHVGLPKG